MSTKTTDLKPGDTVKVAEALNGNAYTATVESVEPWMLTAGPNAGQQAKQGRKPLFTVRLVNARRTSSKPLSGVDALVDASDVRDYASTADATWDVI